MHARCCQWPATSGVHYTTSCNTQSSAPEDVWAQHLKHVQMIGIINKLLLLHLLRVYIIYINDLRSNKYQRKTCFGAISHHCEKWLVASSCLSVRSSAWNNSASTGRIFMKFDTRSFRISVDRFQFALNPDENIRALHLMTNIYIYIYICMYEIIWRSFILRRRNLSDESCREIQNTHFVFKKRVPKIVPLMWVGMVQPDRPHATLTFCRRNYFFFILAHFVY